MKKVIAIIPARKGSKRFPGKNKISFAGIPLVTHSIRYAKRQNFIDSVYVTSDDPEILEFAMKEGVEIVKRPEHLCDDQATTVSAMKHVLEEIGGTVEDVILLQPTNPLRPEDLIKEAYKIFNRGSYDSLMTVSPVEKKLGKITDHRFLPYNYKPGQRSQELDPLYFENGLLYIIKASLIIQEKILGEYNYPLIVKHPYAGVDIDYIEDLEYAEYLIQKISKKNESGF